MATDDPKKSHSGTPKSARPARAHPTAHATGGTNRPETPELEGREPLPAELTGRASGTDDDLVSLFDNSSGEHLADGFRGGSQDVPGSGSEAVTEHDPTEEKR
jgi:hypothetical protein